MNETNPMNLLDAGILSLETERSQMHLGGIALFSLPGDAAPDFVGRIYRYWRSFPIARAPFNYKLSHTRVGKLLPRWEVLDDVDLQHHFYHVSLPYPGREREFVELIGQLHSTQLNRSRPLWEIYLIEGLSDQRFAAYAKFHHALFDGISAVRVFGKDQFSSDPAENDRPPVWAGVGQDAVNESTERPKPDFAASRVVRSASSGIKVIQKAYSSVTGAGALVDKIKGIEWPELHTPDTIFNQPITARRDIALVSLPFARIKQLSKSAACTINDLILTICGGALRRYLDEIGELPDSSLVSLVPVSLNKEGNAAGGNTFTFIPAALGTDMAKVDDRFDTVQESVAKGKAMMNKLPDKLRDLYTGGLLGLTILEGVVGTRLRDKPLFNVIISNVPGTRDPVYLNGAKLNAMGAISIILQDLALNITVVSTHESLCFSITACPDAVPKINRLGALLSESFDELEVVIRETRTTGRSTERRVTRKKNGRRRSA